MRRVDFADAILSLSGDPEQVGPILGDLIEEGESGWDFWLAVCRITVARAWQEVVGSPFSIARLTLRAALAEMGYLLAAFFIPPLASMICAFYFHTGISDRILDWTGFAALNLMAPLFVGQWLARRGQGRAASGALVLSVVHAIINLCAGLCFWTFPLNTAPGDVSISISRIELVSWHGDLSATLSTVATYLTLYPVLLLSGAAISRARQRNSAII